MAHATRRMRVVGLMSGTSLDGLDVALLRFEGDDPHQLSWTLEGFRTRPYGPEERSLLEAALAGGAADLARLHVELARWSAAEVRALLEDVGVHGDEVAAIGSHGQTVWHEPPRAGWHEPPRAGSAGRGAAGPTRSPSSALPATAPSPGAASRGITLQLGDPATLAEETGIAVVSDFRSRDVAAGGHGAPLVAWPDRLLFARPGRSRLLQNLGGMGNLTWLPPRGAELPPVAFDTGPGVVLLDEAVRLATAGRRRVDEDGRRALAGRVDPDLVESVLAMPFFREPPPRTTGRERFGPELVAGLAERTDLRAGEGEEGWNSLMASLVQVTVQAASRAIAEWVRPRDIDEVVLTGGGARNLALVRAFEHALAPLPVRTGSEALGMDPDAREAAAFAVLAWAHLAGLSGNVPSATGARGARILGSLTPGGGGGWPLDGDAFRPSAR